MLLFIFVTKMTKVSVKAQRRFYSLASQRQFHISKHVMRRDGNFTPLFCWSNTLYKVTSDKVLKLNN